MLAVSPARAAEFGALALSGTAVVLRLAVAGGMGRSALLVLCWLAVIASALALALPGEKRWLDPARVLLLSLALWSLPSVYGRVGGDGVEYFVQASSLVFDGDLDFTNDYERLGAPPIVTAEGKVTSRMPVGTALLWAPAVLLSRIALSLASGLGFEIRADQASSVYQSAATVTSFLLGFAALIVLERALRSRYGRSLAFLVTVAIWLATPLYFYMTANPFMSHAASVFASTLFVLSWLKAREAESLRPWVIAGLLGGLMTLVRIQDAVLMVVPIVDLLLARKPGVVRRLSAMTIGAAGPGILQLAIWLFLYGVGFVPTVMSHGRLGAVSPHILGLLVSPRHGLLSWTPLFLSSLLGWLLLARRSRSIALGIGVAFALAVLQNSSNQDWWGSDAFGQRRLLGFLPLFAWGTAETAELLRRRPMILLAASTGILVAWNMQLSVVYNGMMVGTRNDALPLDRVIEAQVELSYRRLLRWGSWMPTAIWVVLYDNLKGVWLDDGSRSLNGLVDLGDEPEGYFPLVGDGWFEPESEGDTRFRRSRTRRSSLTVPIRTPRDYTVEVRARGEVESPIITARLDVNGTAVGEVELASDWIVYRFDAGEQLWTPGLNELTFVYSDTPRTLVKDFHGKNAAWSVDWVRFVPRPASTRR